MNCSLAEALWSAFEQYRGYSNAQYCEKRLLEEENERFYQGQFFQKVFPPTQNILRHIREARFLRPPQVDALELYVYLKEIEGNPTIKELYQRFLSPQRPETSRIWDSLDRELQGLAYPNWLFALGMGMGKTILMATMIFYNFILAQHYPQDKRFARNALVFAPDTTIVHSLREIQEFDYTKVFPREYVLFLSSNLKFHYLTSPEAELNVLPGSSYNIIVSNVQKIVLRKNQEKSYSLYPKIKDLEGEWQVNKRLRQIEKLEGLAIFVDEAHHAFGRSLIGDLKRVRQTINRLNRQSPLAGCVNLTGTPYVKGQILPEVVFSYSVKQAIEEGYLKQVKFIDYVNTKTEDFVRDVVERFWKEYGEERREGLLPKIAFYCTTIAELEEEFRPLLEKALAEKGLPLKKILVNHSRVGEENLRLFRLLDTPEAESQFILLVGKGTEGWNCRSLFATAMYRQPRSKVFLLQSALRCLRAIGDMPQTASIFLSTENRRLLEKELKKNLGLNSFELERCKNRNRPPAPLSFAPATRGAASILLVRLRPGSEGRQVEDASHSKPITGRGSPERLELALDRYYQEHREDFLAQVREGDLEAGTGVFRVKFQEGKVLERRQKRYTLYTLVEEVSRFTHLPCLKVEELLLHSDMGIDGCLAWVNRENRLIEVIIRRVLEHCKRI